MRPHATLREVGLRDGLQLVKSILPTERKIAWLREEAAAGLREVEVTSFVPPGIGPQFADATEMVRAAVGIDGLGVAALVPNLKGAVRAFEAGVHKINFVVSASEAHNLANVRRTTAQSVADFRRIVAERDARGLATRIGGGIATTFGCTIQGRVAESDVLRLVETLAAAGSDELMLADTVGYAHPAQVKRMFSAAAAIFGKPIYAHFHDTRGLGLANVSAAVDAGIRRFDASIGGLGGCPFAPGASGNIDTEDCAFLLESLGFDTGLDIEKLIALREHVAQWLPHERIGGMIAQAGLPKTFAPASAR
jgi:hydroxymethylglutaryl-CoA lyase